MRTNAVREKWANGELVLGTSLLLGSTRAAEIGARAGFDFLMVDTLHGHFDKTSATDAIRAIATTDAVPFGRVAHNDPGRINDLLDAGALGLVVPMVNSVADARAAVMATFYHPKGERSKGSAVATFYGQDYHRQANERIVLVVMIETAEAVAKAGEILGVEGVDACLIGTNDLTLSLGCDQTSNTFQRAIARVADACRTHNVALGIAGGSAGDVERWRSANMSFFLISHDLAVLNAGMIDLAQSLRKTVQP